jgi:two-component system cell cycle response regulator
MNVLVLESGRLFQKVLRDLLLELDCVVDCANSGTEGFALLHDSSANIEYDLIICSQNIFNEHLQEITDYVEKTEHNVPIILLSSKADEDLHVHARAAGIKDIFPKTNLDYLKSCIRYYIKGEQTHSINNGEILYIEDSASVAHIVKSYLKKLDIEVTHFLDADEAFKALTTDVKDYDLIITDVMLQGVMDGLSLVRMIRAENSPMAKTPILAMTGNDDVQLRKDLLHAGVTDYITKPASEEGLVTRIKNLIAIKRLSDKVNQQERALYKLSVTDQLTGCQNKNSLLKYASKYINNATRYQHGLSVIVIELDAFDKLQEKHGRDIGDSVLTKISESLMKSCRQGDIVARVGGEEFSILLPHCKIEHAIAKAEKTLSMIQSLQPEKLSITASIGVSALINEHKEDFTNLYQSARNASQKSKKNGYNQVTADDQSMHASTQSEDTTTSNTSLTA